MAKPRRYAEYLTLRLLPGTLAEIDAVLREKETRQDFVREAVAERLRDDLNSEE